MSESDSHIHQPDMVLPYRELMDTVKEPPDPHPVDSRMTNRAQSAQRLSHRSHRPQFTQFRNFCLALLFLAPALITFAIFSYLPLLRAFWLSMNVTNELGDPVKFIGLGYYASVLNLDGANAIYVRSIFLSIQFTLAVVILQIVCSLALAGLAMAKVRGIGIFRLICTLSIAISLASSSVIWALIFDPSTGMTTWITDLLHLPQPGLLNNPATALWAVIIVSVWSGLGFNFVITLAGMQGIPEELYESGALDGAGGWNKFRYITLPLLTPILLFLLIANTIEAFQAFTQFNVLVKGSGPANSTYVFVQAIFQSFWVDQRYGFASAMSIILFFILLLFSAIQFFGLGKRVHYS